MAKKFLWAMVSRKHGRIVETFEACDIVGTRDREYIDRRYCAKRLVEEHGKGQLDNRSLSTIGCFETFALDMIKGGREMEFYRSESRYKKATRGLER